MHTVIRHVFAITLVALIAGCAAPANTTPSTAARAEIIWLGQSAFKITTSGGKVIVTDPWLRTNPLTPADYKKLDALRPDRRAAGDATGTSTTSPTPRRSPS